MRIIKLQEFAFHKIFATTQKENFHIGTRVKALTFKDGEKSEAVRFCRRLSWVDATQLFLCLNRQPSIRLCFHLQTHFFIQCNVMLNEKII